MDMEKIQRVRNYLALLPDVKFDMRFPFLIDGCGCIGAHARDILHASMSTALSDDEGLGRLIMPPYWFRDCARYTRAGAVRVLDHLLATGEVDWSIIDAPQEEAREGERSEVRATPNPTDGAQ